MRRTMMVLAALAVFAAPASAQLSDAQLRQQVGYAIARTENLIDEAQQTIARLQTIMDVLTARVDAPAPDPTPEPEPEPTPDPDPVPPPTGLAWLADWDAALGNSDAAISDGGQFTGFVCQQRNQLLSVIDVAGQRRLRVSADGSTGCGMVQVMGRVPAPAIGQSIEHRVGLEFRATGGDVGNQHFLQPPSSRLPHSWNWRWQRPSNGRVVLEWILVNQVQGWPNSRAVYAVSLPVGVPMELSYTFTRTGTGTATMEPVITLADGTVLDADDFRDVGEGATAGQSMRDGRPVVQFSDERDLTEFELGQNGPAGASSVIVDYFHAWNYRLLVP